VDGLEPQSIQEILATEVGYLRERHQSGAEIFATMGNFAPALGMIGTLIGLVQMLQSMEDPSTIGPAMAVALLTTFYGSVLANLVCMPIAGKLRTRSKEETLVKEMILEGVVSLTKGENPRILEQKMLSFVPPKLRSSSF
jgi:chemotaxis protein MotA